MLSLFYVSTQDLNILLFVFLDIPHLNVHVTLKTL